MNIEEWLKSFEEKEENESFFIYILKDNVIYPYKTKYKKDGDLAKGKYIYSTENFDVPEYIEMKQKVKLSEDEKEILKLLFVNNKKSIQGSIGYLIIEKLVKIEKLYNENLEKFNLKEINYEIKIDEFIYIDVDDDIEFLLTDPILGKNENTIFKLIPPLDLQIFKKLQNSPLITDPFLAYRKLRNLIPLKQPENYKITTLDTTPTPIITLQMNKYILVSFEYDKYEIKPYPKEEITIRYTANGEIQIKRKLDIEEEFIEKIQSFGFKDLENTFIANSDDTQTKLEIWDNFLDNLNNLNCEVRYDNFDITFSDESEISVESSKEKNWFNLSFDIKIGRKNYPLLPIIVPILKEIKSLNDLKEKIRVEYAPNKYITLNTKEIKPILKTIFELLDKYNGKKLEINPFEAHLLDIDEDIRWKGSKELQKLSNQLKNFDGIKEVTPPKGLSVKLRDYQKFGLNWLMFLHQFKFGGILADDMGLGKTIQTLSFLLKLKETKKLKKPALIIMPTSLIGNWKSEVEKFTPDLSYIAIYGNNRGGDFRKIKNYDLVFTTYNLIVRDFEIYEKIDFEYIILDEAQKIKNPRTKTTQTIKLLNSEYKLALSGTPIENNLIELWSIFSFLMPGFLWNYKFFKQNIESKIEDNEIRNMLNKRIKPFVLRRTKEKVAKELPKKSEIIKYVEFEEPQAKLYESIRVIMEKKVRDAITQNGLAKSQVLVLDALLKLRQICCHPKLLNLEEAKKVKNSAKLELFLELVDDLIQEGRKILVFSQFTSMLSIIEEELNKKDIKHIKLTGSTKNRDEVIDKFKNGNIPVFLISLKAGGVGLNLTEADTVIHYDPWWNKAVENQATDRAYRIGQDKNVFVYKLIVKNTIEEKILELQKQKENLQQIYETAKFEPTELLELLK